MSSFSSNPLPEGTGQRNAPAELRLNAGALPAHFSPLAVLRCADALFDAEPAVRRAIATRLISLGPDLVPIIPLLGRSLVLEQDESTRHRVVKAVGGMGSHALPLLGALYHCCGASEPWIREAAFAAIRRVGTESRHGFAALYVQSVRESDTALSGQIREYLMSANRELLLTLEKFDKLMMRLGTAEQLQALETLKGAKVTPEVIDMLTVTIGLTQSERVRLLAADYLAAAATQANQFSADRMLVLLQYLTAGGSEGRRIVKDKLIEALSMLAAGANPPRGIQLSAPVVLAELQRSNDPGERAWLAYQAYCLDQGVISDALPVMFDGLRAKDGSSRAHTLDCLGEMVKSLPAEEAREVGRRIARAVLDEEQEVRLAAVSALGNMIDESPFALTVIGSYLCDTEREPTERVEAMDALVSLRLHLPAEHCGRVVSLLAYIMNDGDGALSEKAAEVLQHYGPYLRDGFNLFRRALEKESGRTVAALVRLLDSTRAEVSYTVEESAELATSLLSAAQRLKSVNGRTFASTCSAAVALAEKLTPRN